MKIVLQRVKSAVLRVDNEAVSKIGRGIVVFFGVERGDLEEDLLRAAEKIPKLRIFADENGKTNLSLFDIGGEILLVSQFTLLGKCGKGHGNRPDFGGAEEPARAEAMYNLMADTLRKGGTAVKLGVFGAHMEIEQLNDGPFTIIL
ncbi:MAG TPA: D-aminoacyl-tRNA deacylase [Eubacteriales bacterium]|jgi:D-tyrosyl-tRNA(Tyr) deacylase|nr:D-aminoacyl-tRNA deacylase [Eubacteriales bacterium]HRU84631.1 D-aminoacyl-tRNA deacylase [Eubacteriales bacterium]